MKRIIVAAVLAASVATGSATGAYAATKVWVKGPYQSSQYCKKADHGKWSHNKQGKVVHCVTYTAWHWKNS